MTPRDEAIETVARALLMELKGGTYTQHDDRTKRAAALVDHITTLLTRAALDAAEARLRDAVDDFSFLRDVIRKNRIASPPPHRLQISDGSWHEGPVVDFVHDILGEMELYLDAALRAGKGVE